MLKKITLKNFRQHRDREIDFTPGLNVLRGENEAGKSGVLEAICYALFGAKSCREPLEFVVTRGEKESTLKVTLDMEMEGTQYIITRAKSGAEVNWDGGKVVGQTEVTTFVARLLGVPATSVKHLILSGQGNIRGALDSGSAKTAELIEQLSNFEILDDIIQTISERLVTGSEGGFVAKMEQAATELEAAEVKVEKPDTVADEEKLAGLQKTAADHLAEVETIRGQVKPLAIEKEKVAKIAAAVAAKAGEAAQFENLAAVAQKDADGVVVGSPADATLIGLAEDQLRRSKDAAALQAIKASVDAWKLPETHWEGSKAEFESARLSTSSRLQAEQQSVVKLKGEIALHKSQLITGSACGYCGKDVSSLPEVATKNSATQSQLDAAMAACGAAQTAANELAEEFLALTDVATSAKSVEALIARHPDLIEVVDTTYPPTLKWLGGDVHSLDVATAQAQLDALKKLDRDHLTAKSRRDTLLQAVEQHLAAGKVAAEYASANAAEAARLPEIENQLRDLGAEEAEVFGKHFTAREEALALSNRLRDALAEYNTAVARRTAAEEKFAIAKRELETIQKNNLLLKKVRAARPAIGNQLWAKVLQSVSGYFSEMRGTPSMVTKDGDGFKADGYPIEGLSGSALDILGLAIRYALTRTFIPHTPFMVLDEPSAACSDMRTEKMLAFLVSSGFKQTLLVTHEGISETVADNLIRI